MLALPAFARSERFGRLDEEDLKLSTIVADAFGSFVIDPATSLADVDAALALLEDLASWNDYDVDGLLQVGVVKAPETADLLRLGPQFGSHFERLVSER